MSKQSVRIRRARLEEVRSLADEYVTEAGSLGDGGAGWAPPIPRGGIFWIAERKSDQVAVGFAAGALRADGCTVGPIFTRPSQRRNGVGQALLTAIQDWAATTGVPVVDVPVAPDNEAGVEFLRAFGYEPRSITMSRAPLTPTDAGSGQ